MIWANGGTRGDQEMTTSTTRHRKRPKSHLQKPNFSDSPNSTPISSSSTLTSLISQAEPPPHLLPSSKSDFFKLILVLINAAIVAVFCHFIAAALNRPLLPFCDSDVADFDYFLSDSCEHCPRNGRCYDGQLDCIQGYRKYGKQCIEDGEIFVTARKLSELTKDRMCKDYANYICDGTGVIWVSINDLKNLLDDYGLDQGFPMDDAKYLYIRETAMEDIHGIMDTRTDDGIEEFKCPDALAESYKSVACQARKWIADRFLVLTSFCATLAVCTLILVRFRRRWYLSKRAEHLYDKVCGILEDKALRCESKNGEEPWLVASRLRDHLLSTSERRDPHLWKTVEELVESDSRLDCYPKLVKGESKVVWEWQVEGSLSASRRKKVDSSYLVSGEPAMNSSDKKQQSVEIGRCTGIFLMIMFLQ